MENVYLYHRVPEDMRGTVLYSLNILQDKYPEAYVQAAKKYENRQWVRELCIPMLDCLWNDVLHLTPVSPEQVRQALMEAGQTIEKTWRYYRIDPKLLNPEKAVIYLDSGKGNGVTEEDFLPYTPENLAGYTELPEVTKEYYKEMVVQGIKPLLFHKAPHVLYRGMLDVSNTTIISVW